MDTSIQTQNPDYTSLENNLISLEKRKNAEISFCEDIASLIAYQHSLCSHLGLVYALLSKVVPQPRHPFPALPFSNHPISMAQTSRCTLLLQSITKLLWSTVAITPESADIFARAHNGFNEMLIKRNEFVWMKPNPLPPSSLIEKSTKENSVSKDSRLSTLADALNLVIDRNDKLDNSFLPKSEILDELQLRLGEEPSPEKIQQLFNDYERTQKELFNLLREMRKSKYNSSLFMQYPHLDIIQELPCFQEALSSIGVNSVDVRSELYEFTRTVSNSIRYFREVFAKFESCFALPQIDFYTTQHLLSVEVQHYKAQRRMNFFRQVKTKAQMKPAKKWSSLSFLESEFNFLTEIKKKIMAKKIDDCEPLFNDAFTRYETAETEIKEEIQSVNEAKVASESASRTWYDKSFSSKDQSDGKLLNDLYAVRKETEEKVIRNQVLRDHCSSNLINTISRAKAVVNSLNDAPIIPLTFEDKMNKLSDKVARLEWLKSKSAALKKKLEKQKAELQEFREKSEKLDQQIAQKKEEFEKYQEKSKTDPVVDNKQSLSEFEEMKNLYFCYCKKISTKERRRVTFLKECKHSFCAHCVQKQIKSRNRTCPYCHTHFNPSSDIVEISWVEPQNE